MNPGELLKIAAAESPKNFASYRVCSHCNQIISPKPKKSRRVHESLWVHNGCYDNFIASAIKRAAERARKSVEEKA